MALNINFSNNPLVSIIVPVYGVEEYIITCLKSIDNQSYENIECIIINDCTKDKSMLLVNSFIHDFSKRPSIYKIINHSENKGLSETRNSGIKIANGDYIYFLDSDDYIASHCIKNLVDTAVKYNVDIVWGGIERISNNGKHNYNIIGSQDRIYNRSEILYLYSKQKLYTEASNKLIKRNYIINNNLFFVPQLLHEDVNWTFKLLASEFTGAIVDIPTYYYLQRDGSITSKLTQKNYYAQIENIKLINSIINTYKLKSDIDYLKYFQYMIEYSIWMLFYRKCSITERYNLYKKLRDTKIDFKYISTKAQKSINFTSFHFTINNIYIAFFFFELQNTFRRIKNRIKI